MLKLQAIDRLRPHNGALVNRVALLEAALEGVTAYNTELVGQVERLRAENTRLLVALEKHMSLAAPVSRRDAAREMTAGTSEGPRPRRTSKPHARYEAASA